MLSLVEVAQLAGYVKIDFISKLIIENEPIFDYDNEAMSEIIKDSVENMKILQK